jgi:transposase
MTDKIAASILARLLAKGLLVGVWVPPQEVRELRGLVAQRQKMTRLATQAKNRLHAVIQRHHLLPPEGNPFAKKNNGWWESLALGQLEKMNLQSDLETLQFSEKQESHLQEEMTGIAAEDEEIGRLLHIAGFGVITAVTVYAAIGDIHRFEDAKHLVGYAGMGTRVHDSGLTTRTGKTLAPRCGAVQVSRKQADAICVWRWWKRRTWQPTAIHIGRRSWHDWNRVWDGTKRSWRSRESCWLPSGMCWRARWRTVLQNLKRYRRRCCTSPMTWAR